jgi:hypothetical protein
MTALMLLTKKPISKDQDNNVSLDLTLTTIMFIYFLCKFNCLSLSVVHVSIFLCFYFFKSDHIKSLLGKSIYKTADCHLDRRQLQINV